MKATIQNFIDIAQKSGGQYFAVTGYESQTGSISNFILRPGVSAKRRLENSIQWAERLNKTAVRSKVNDYYSNRVVKSFPNSAFSYGTVGFLSGVQKQEAKQWMQDNEGQWPFRLVEEDQKFNIYETVSIPLAGFQAYIDSQVDSWKQSLKKPQREMPYTPIASAKNGQPILNLKPEEEAIYMVGQMERCDRIKSGPAKRSPKSDSAKVKKWIRDHSDSGKYTTLKLQVGDSTNFSRVSINGQVYRPSDIAKMVVQARSVI
jgi:hypothetical protein